MLADHSDLMADLLTKLECANEGFISAVAE